MEGVAFEFDGVTVERDGQTVLDTATGTLADHGVTLVVGPSGSGKSTLLRLCNRLTVPTTGMVRYRGTDTAELDPLTLRREVGMVFQRPVPLPGTVADNLRVARPGASTAEVATALDRVGLAGVGDKEADALSGGEAQRMCLARTLIAAPAFVLFDEPTSSLDPGATRAIERIAREMADDGIPSAWVTHDLDQMRRLAHHLVVVVGGRIVQQGDATQVLDAPTPAVADFLTGGNR